MAQGQVSRCPTSRWPQARPALPLRAARRTAARGVGGLGLGLWRRRGLSGAEGHGANRAAQRLDLDSGLGGQPFRFGAGVVDHHRAIVDVLQDLDIADVNIVLHLGTLLSILVYYRQRVLNLTGSGASRRRESHLALSEDSLLAELEKVWNEILLDSLSGYSSLRGMTGFQDFQGALQNLTTIASILAGRNDFWTT